MTSMPTDEQGTAVRAVDPRDLVAASDNPKNRDYPEIITVTQTDESSEATEEHSLIYETGSPKGSILVKKLTTVHTTIRTTTPYTGTL